MLSLLHVIMIDYVSMDPKILMSVTNSLGQAAITALSTRVEQLASNQPTATTTISDATHIVDVFDKKLHDSSDSGSDLSVGSYRPP